MAARSWVPGLSEVVCTENGGPLSPDQFSRRQVTATAIRAPFGHAKLFDFSVMTSTSTIRCKALPGYRAVPSLAHFLAAFAAAQRPRLSLPPSSLMIAPCFRTLQRGGGGHTMKTILVPTESHETIRPALETALMLARRFDSYIEGFALRFRINEFVAVDMAGAIPLESLRDENLEEARRARQIFEAFMGEHAVPRADATASSLSYGWLDDAPEGE